MEVRYLDRLLSDNSGVRLGNILPNVGLIPFWICKHAPKISSTFGLDHPMQLCYSGITSDVLRDPLSMSTKPFIVIGKEHDLAPS